MKLSSQRASALLLIFALLGTSFTSARAQSIADNKTAPAGAPALPGSKPGESYPSVPSDGYDVMNNPVVADSLKGGGKAYYIGNRDNLDGWLLMQGNEVQIVYMTADRKTMIIGNLFATEGYNITADQIRVLLKNNKEVSSSMNQSTREQLGVTNNNMQPNGMPKIPKLGDLSNNGGGGVADDINPGAPAAHLLEMAQNAPNARSQQAAPAIPAGERLLLDLQDANGIDVGAPTAPILYMIMDPNCPHCQATWRLLRDAVFAKRLRVRLVPVGRNEEDDRAAAQLFRVPDPLNAWDKYVAGDKSQLAGNADPKFIAEVRANHAMMDGWNINETPYMAYRSAHSSDMKVIGGEPTHADDLIADVGQ